ncbi:alpha/beta-Hydrolase [Apiospora hydei]|uniref:Alpha/beta-Hydrolase n=1 Tax=Apiospora hydei TaxID=1337664 RepID=A0ABR1WQ65_9PEZI
MSSSTTIWSSQPFRTLYTVGFWSVNIPHLLYLALRNSIAPIRAVPQWGYQTSMGAAILRALFRYLAVIRYQQPRQMVPGKAQDRFVLIAPPDATLFRGVLGAPATATQPEPVGAVWSPAPVPVAVAAALPGNNDDKITTGNPPPPPRHRLCRGGGFVTGWDPDENSKNISALATDHFDGTAHVLYAQYRLASRAHPFPAAVQDLLAAYHHVLGLGVPPRDVVLMGDSAGANLVLAVLRYLAAQGLRQPGGAVLFSPWVEVTAEAVQRYSRSVASRHDILDVPLLEWGVDAYRPQGKPLTQEEEGYISPLHHPFRLETRLYVNAGSLDGVYESISLFARQMADVAGNRVRFHTTENMPHDYFLTYPLLGTKEEACAALRNARDFLRG